ncbi:MAG: hypothetical protein RR348_00665, partial [Clostridia bacterium]
IADSAGYLLENSFDSVGGYKDWFVATTTKLGLTVEVGGASTKFSQLQGELPIMIQQNNNVLNVASQCAKEIFEKTK